MSPYTYRLARDLNLEAVLGTMENVNEAMRILVLVSSTRFDTFPVRWRNLSEHDGESVGRVGPGADYFNYNIHSNRALTENEAYRWVHRTREQVPDGHPRSWNYDTMPDC